MNHAKGSYPVTLDDYFPRIARGHGSQRIGKCNACRNPADAAHHVATVKVDGVKLMGKAANHHLHTIGER